MEVPRSAHWNGETIQANSEWLIERERFDAGLLADLRAADVHIVSGRVRRFSRIDQHWFIELNDIAEENITADFLIDARGRAAPHSDYFLQRGPLSMALSRLWRLPAATPAMTQVMSFADGWCWYAAGDQGLGSLQIMVSSERQRLPARSQLPAYYAGLLQQIPELSELIETAQPASDIVARYAQPQFTRELIGDHHARVGDAAFAIDPLSGHGIYQAVGGALALAATVHTLLARPDNTAIARRFYRERVESDFLRMARIGRDFYRQEQRWPEPAFWYERSRWPDDEPAHPAAAQDQTRIEQRPVNIDGVIELREVIVTADHPRGVWQIAGVALVPLLLYTRDRQVETMEASAAHYAANRGEDLQSCRTALAWLAARRLLQLSPVAGESRDAK
jgi:flavin-dependent dehydrogenase